MNPLIGRKVFWGILIAAVSMLAGLYIASDAKADLQKQLANTLIQFVVVLVFGAFVADWFKEREKNRRDQEQLAVFRDETRKRLGDCYQAAKRARCILRGAGFIPELCDGQRPVPECCLQPYRAQMEAVNEIQLDLEKIRQEIDSHRAAFSDPEGIIRRIQIMSGFLRKIVNEYEAQWPCLSGQQGSISLPPLKQLAHFVGTSTKGWFKEKFCDRYSEAVEIIRKDTLRVNV
jgi:hypothetical protein